MAWEFETVNRPSGSPTDGPVWDGSALLFSQLAMPWSAADNSIRRYEPTTGRVTDYRRWTHRTAGLAFSAEGTLYGCQSICRRIVRFNTDGTTNPLAYHIDGKFHNQPKDLTVDSQGRIWFSDPVWGPPVQGGLRADELEPKTIEYRAVLRMSSPDRHAHLERMTFDTDAPGGILLSQDERTLYVSENSDEPGGNRQLRAYEILGDGSLGHYALLHTFGADYRGGQRGVSGMCLDTEGNIVACAGWNQSGPGPMVYVFSAQGQVLETHPLPADQPTNCAFGGAQLGDLYVTTNEGHLLRARDVGRRGWVRFPSAE